jgi:Arc/MetJ-type ribon-helix-helix transcriptional regulator
MARFMVSMPDDMLKKLDSQARKESRGRSELLREAVRHHLAAIAPVEAKKRQPRDRTANQRRKRSGLRKPWNATSWKTGWAVRAAPGLISW